MKLDKLISLDGIDTMSLIFGKTVPKPMHSPTLDGPKEVQVEGKPNLFVNKDTGHMAFRPPTPEPERKPLTNENYPVLIYPTHKPTKSGWYFCSSDRACLGTVQSRNGTVLLAEVLRYYSAEKMGWAADYAVWADYPPNDIKEFATEIVEILAHCHLDRDSTYYFRDVEVSDIVAQLQLPKA